MADDEPVSTHVDNSGNRHNAIQTLSRICPVGFCPNAITVEENDVSIFDANSMEHDSWLLDDNFDCIPPSSESTDTAPVFATQDIVWSKVDKWLNDRISKQSSNFAILALGGEGSGKTFTLYGDRSRKERGIVPRSIEKMFSPCDDRMEQNNKESCYIALQMYILDDERIVDLLSPIATNAKKCDAVPGGPIAIHRSDENIAYGNHSHQVLLYSITTVICYSEDEAQKAIEQGIIAAAMYGTTCDILHSMHMITSIDWVHTEARESQKTGGSSIPTVRKVIFAEIASFDDSPGVVPSTTDRLTSFGLQHAGTRCLREYTQHCGSTEYLNKKDITKSLLTYVLQTSVFKFPDCMVIGCLRGNKDAYSDNAQILDFLNRLDSLSDPESKVLSHPSMKSVLSSLMADAEEVLEQISQLKVGLEKMINSCYAKLKSEALTGAKFGTTNKHEGHHRTSSTNYDSKSNWTLGLFGDEVEVDKRGNAKRYESAKKQYMIAVRKYYFLLDKIWLYQSKGTKVSGRSAIPRNEWLSLPHGSSLKLGESTHHYEYGYDAALRFNLLGCGRCDPFPQTFASTWSGSEHISSLTLTPLVSWLCYQGIGTHHSVKSFRDRERNFTKRSLASRAASPVTSAYGVPCWTDSSFDKSDGEPFLLAITPTQCFSTHYVQYPLLQGKTICCGFAAPNPVAPTVLNTLPIQSVLQPYDELNGEDELNGDDVNVEEAVARTVPKGPTNYYPPTIFPSFFDNYNARFDAYSSLHLPPPSSVEGSPTGTPAPSGPPSPMRETPPPETDPPASPYKKQEVVSYIRIACNSKPDDIDVDMHCTIDRLMETVTLIPTKSAQFASGLLPLFLNGKRVVTDTVLRDLDIITIGTMRFFQVIIPKEKSLQDAHAHSAEVNVLNLDDVDDLDAAEEDTAADDMGESMRNVANYTLTETQRLLLHGYGQQLTTWEFALWRMCGDGNNSIMRHLIIDSETQRLHKLHSCIDRHMNSIEKCSDATPLSCLEDYNPPADLINRIMSNISLRDKVRICKYIMASKMAMYWSNTMQCGSTYKIAIRQYVDFENELKGIYPPLPSRADRAIYVQATNPAQKEEELDTSSLNEGSSVGGSSGRRSSLAESKHQLRVLCNWLLTDESRIYTVGVQFANDEEGSGWWSWDIFISRFYLMRWMHFDYVFSCNRSIFRLSSKYPVVFNPFSEIPDDELIGVSCIFMESLYYMLDIDDYFPIVSFSGHNAGTIKLSIRSWVDKIETIPSYLTADGEMSLNDFSNRMLLVRVNVDSLHNIPANVSTGNYVNFKFFFHPATYKSSRYLGKSISPKINQVIAIAQKITPDFVDFVRTGYIDVEVWGKRGANSNDISSHLSLLNVNPGPGNVAPPGPALFGNIFTHCVGDKDSNVVLPSFEEEPEDSEDEGEKEEVEVVPEVLEAVSVRNPEDNHRDLHRDLLKAQDLAEKTDRKLRKIVKANEVIIAEKDVILSDMEKLKQKVELMEQEKQKNSETLQQIKQQLGAAEEKHKDSVNQFSEYKKKKKGCIIS